MNETASLEQLAALVDFSADAVVLIDIDGVIRWANAATRQVLGYEPADLIGVRVRDLVEPEDQAAWSALVAGLLDQPAAPAMGAFRRRHRDGSVRWTEGVARNLLQEPRVGALVVYCRDITERRRAEQALRAAEEKYRVLVEQSLVGVYILQNERLVYVNPKGADILGYTQQELLDLPSAYSLLHDQDRALVMDQLAGLGSTGPLSVQLTVRGMRKDSTVVQTEACCTATEFADQPAILATVIDISDHVKLEDQLRHAQRMEAVGRLAGGISHDFNNLLTAIRGNAELMSQRVKHDPAMAAEVDEIIHAADRAASLTRQLLLFSRKQVLQPVALDINEIVGAVARMARRLIGADVQLRLDVAPTVARVLADPPQIEQVLLNLIVNARDAMPNGGRIEVSTQNVTLRAGDQDTTDSGLTPGPYVLLAVADDGLGMDPSTQAHIFEPFFTTKETGRGTGLGLATVYAIVRQTGGAITVTSERGQGASFRVFLPALTGETT